MTVVFKKIKVFIAEHIQCKVISFRERYCKDMKFVFYPHTSVSNKIQVYDFIDVFIKYISE